MLVYQYNTRTLSVNFDKTPYIKIVSDDVKYNKLNGKINYFIHI